MGKTRILLESRGKPKAALISAEDLEKLEQLERGKETPGSSVSYPGTGESPPAKDFSSPEEDTFGLG